MTIPKNRKSLGQWGEENVDQWMKGVNYSAILKNHRFPGGELDRVYHNPEDKTLCVAEIKCLTQNPRYSLSLYLGDAILPLLVRKKQKKNLMLAGNQLLRTFPEHQIYLRYFVVIKSPKGYLTETHSETLLFGGKILQITEDYLLLSFNPIDSIF
jgi:Holliday junction resolvase-like predicted endonuclease